MIHEMVLERRGIRSNAIWMRWPFTTKLFGRLAVWIDRRVLERSQYWPRERMRVLQEERLRVAIAKAIHIPFWEFRLGKLSSNQYMPAQIGLTTKRELATAGLSKSTNQYYSAGAIKDKTSGTTGVPFRFLVDEPYMLRSFSICERMFRVAGKGKRYRIVSMRMRERVDFALSGATLFFVRGFNAVKYRIDSFFELYASGEEFVLYSFPTTLSEFTSQIASRNDLPKLPIKAVLTGGERITDNTRNEIHKTLGVGVFSTYSLRELGWIAFGCGAGKMHINEESYFVEITDQDGKSVPAGKSGKIVVTSFEHSVMAYIRYDTGDTGIINGEACECGRSLRTIEVKGREEEIVSLLGGRNVPLLEFSSALDKFTAAIRTFQIVQESERRIRIRIVPATKFSEKKNDIREAIRRMAGPGVTVDIEETYLIEESRGGKALHFVRNTTQ